MSDFRWLSAEFCPTLMDELSCLTPAGAAMPGEVGVETPGDVAIPERTASANPQPAREHWAPGATTFSDLGERLSARAHQVAAVSVAVIATSADGAATASEPRTCGELACPTEDPKLVLGSQSNATLFSRGSTLVHAERTASVSSSDTARVVASRKVDLHSPEEVEIAGRRSTRVTSSNLVDVRAAQISLLAGSSRADFDEPLASDVSAAVVGERALHVRSVEGELVACAREDLVLHSHAKNIRVIAKQSVAASAGAFTCSAGTVTMCAQRSVRLEAPGAEVTIEGGVVTVTASSIRLVADVTVTGSLDVAGGIRGAVQGR